MNSHSFYGIDKHCGDDRLDLSLRRSLKNWASRKHPPLDSRERLLKAASKTSVRKSIKIPSFLMFTLSSDHAELSFQRFAKATAYALQAGTSIL
jgi:hypothetical protein